MTEDDLKAIEARCEAATNCLPLVKKDIPALTAALREAWERAKTWEQVANDTALKLEKAQVLQETLWVTATRARNKLHAHNRPRFPEKLRLEIRDMLDEAISTEPQL